MASTSLQILLAASADTARSSMLAVLLVVIGAPVWHLLSLRLNNGRLSGSFAALCGLLVLSIFSWHAYRYGVSVKPVYVALIAIGTGWLLFAAFRLRDRVSSLKFFLPGAIGTAAAFGVPVLIYGVLGHSRLGSTSLPLLITGNNDLLMYLKCADVLLRLPDVGGQVGQLQMGPWLGNDVFAVFNLLALSAYVQRTGVVEAAMPVLGLALGLVGLAIATVSRRIFLLPWWQAILLATLFTTSPLFSYVSLNYFLAQIFFMGVLLAVFAQMAEAANGSATRASAIAATLIGALATMFVYQPWLLPFAVLASVACAAAVSKTSLLRPLGVATLVAASVVMFLAMNGLAVALATSRYVIVLGKIMPAAVGHEPGWPLPFINPALLLGLPAWWQTPDALASVASQILPAAAILGLLVFAAWRLDPVPAAQGRRFALACLLAVLGLYLVAYLAYGMSYRQWKFATTLVAPFGFVAAAYALTLCRGIAALSERRLAVAACCAFLALCIGENVSQYLKRWGTNLIRFSPDLRGVSRADTDPASDAVYIDLPGYEEKMAAALFVSTKPIFFSGVTYFGPGQKIETVPFAKVAVFRRSCALEGQSGASEIRRTLSRPGPSPLRLGARIALSGALGDCVQLQGFSSAEPWGRWTDGKTASIKMRCDCDLSQTKVRLVLNAGALLVSGHVERQRAILTVNGGAPSERVFDTGERRDIAIDVPPAPGDNSLIELKIELPDAMSPASVGASADPRVLGLSVGSVALFSRAD